MRSARQCLWHVVAAPRTILACVFGADFHNGLGGVFSLVLQNQKELSPSGVSNHTGKMVIPEHPAYVQIFNINRIKAANEGIGRFVLEVQPGSFYAQMGFRQQDFCLCTAFALLARQFAVLVSASTAFQSFLRLADARLRFFEVTRIGNRGMVIRERSELLDADIYPDIHACFGKRLRLDFTGNGGVPAIRLASMVQVLGVPCKGRCNRMAMSPILDRRIKPSSSLTLPFHEG
jgi:hypothetical protein